METPEQHDARIRKAILDGTAVKAGLWSPLETWTCPACNTEAQRSTYCDPDAKVMNEANGLKDMHFLKCESAHCAFGAGDFWAEPNLAHLDFCEPA